MPSTKQFINNNISIKLLGKQTKNKSKSKRKMNRVGAFQAVDNGNGFSQPVNLLSKRNDTFERPTLQSESENNQELIQ